MKNLAKAENLSDKMDFQFDPSLVDSSVVDVPAGFKVRPLTAADFDNGLNLFVLRALIRG